MPDGERAEVERDLVALGRAASLGDLAADVAHDVANPLFGVLGLVELLLEDATPGSDEEARLRMVLDSTLQIRTTLQALLDYARARPGEGDAADAAAAVRAATALVQHGIGKSLEVEPHEPAEPVVVACGRAELVQALLHLLLAARPAGRITVEIAGETIRIVPAATVTVGVTAAGRIAADAGGALSVEDDAFVLRLPTA